MGVSAGRLLALAALGEARRSGRWVRDALRRLAERSDESPEDRALAWRLAMGATAAKGLLEERLCGLARRAGSIQPQVMDALTLSAFELLYLKTPIPVAVSEGVELVRSAAPRATGFANAILRKLAPLRDEVHAARERMDEDTDTEDDVALVSGLPRWLLGALNRSLPHKDFKALCSCSLEPAPSWEAKVGEGERATVLRSDLAAQAVALLTVPPDGTSRLEMGMGRGTKTLIVAHALAEAGERAELVGVEPDRRRLQLARGAFADLGYDVAAYQVDGRALDEVPELRDRTFDLVFVDVPCSGTGTMRRHPETPWSLSSKSLDSLDPESLVSLQSELLAAASRSVAKGGLLAYSTCSVLERENEGQVERFLASYAGRAFESEDLREGPGYGRLPRDVRAFVDAHRGPRGSFATSPAPGAPDGHFLRFLRRT